MTDRRAAVLPSIVWMGLLATTTSVQSQDLYEREPIRYSEATPVNPVARLRERLDDGTATLSYEKGTGYLRSVLKALDIPESSQVLVYSKTSLQRQRIAPKTPRAIYFNDEVMVGFCLRGDVMELAAADEAIGTAYYTIDQSRGETPRPERQTESCLICHGTSATRGIPGHLVRSVFVDRHGEPVLGAGTYRTEHSSPLAERWGGWYVTGTSGAQKHLGNLILEDRKPPRRDFDNTQGVNVVDLADRFTVGLYPTPHSDIVALMVLEHQVGMLNRIARASIETRLALHDQQVMNEALKRPAEFRSDTTRSRIRGVAEDVVKHLLFVDEAPLSGPIAGTSPFAGDFPARGPRDSRGRSLRDLDLQTRLFRHPCSYLIHSRAFDALPAEAKDAIYRRLADLLTGRATGKDNPAIPPADREAILAILLATKTDLPPGWPEIPGP